VQSKFEKDKKPYKTAERILTKQLHARDLLALKNEIQRNCF